MNHRIPLAVALFAVACSGPLKYQLASSPKAPGADAKVIADVQDSGHQTLLNVSISNLPPPDRVTEGAAHYVAWYRKGSDAVWARIGGIAYDASSRGGTLKGSVPEIAFDFEITPEKDDSPASPSSDIVFSQRVAK